MTKPLYLLVTSIPFAQTTSGQVLVHDQWAHDLVASKPSFVHLRVVAPLISEQQLHQQSDQLATISPDESFTFQGFPCLATEWAWWRWPGLKKFLKEQIRQADCVHTSNFYAPYFPLYQAHHLAVALKKPTLFVISEDFYDILSWKTLRGSLPAWRRWNRQRRLDCMEKHVKECASTAELTFLHTPSVVQRYRGYVKQGYSIRQPSHHREDVIGKAALEKKCERVRAGKPLTLAILARLDPIKGIDFAIRAMQLLKRWGMDYKLLIYGKGEEEVYLKHLVERFNLQDCVIFKGFLKNGPDIWRAMSEVDLLLMPHRTCDFGRAYYDGICGGAALIAFDTSASNETVRNEVDGLLTPIDNVFDFASAIYRCHQDRDLLCKFFWQAREKALQNTQEAWMSFRHELIAELLHLPVNS